MNEQQIKELFNFIDNLFRTNPNVWISENKIASACMKKYGANVGLTKRVLQMVCEDNPDIDIDGFAHEYMYAKQEEKDEKQQ